MRQNDLRVIKTRKNIESSFIELLGEKDFTKITVQDILDRALINRSTFYKHYADKCQLAEKMCSEIFDMFKASVQDRFLCKCDEKLITTLQNLYQNLSKKREVILQLFEIHTETIHLYQDMLEYLEVNFSKESKLKESDDHEMLDYLACLYASHVMTTMKWCLQNNAYELLLKHTEFFLKFREIFQ
ncbi:TetR/AcrR family transcriptional regulator [Anaerosacchariphilus polymeriproducens]|uniref:TetR/AcrR family transcriptional regulator n=1 Tax=Anaerosacchariphilus polymeriproducens TaxID=1812858 RepID=A0A371AVG6_9FIRM|nr:TetR/AcrR family transcriptional regulator [Anaerosacchariphilus polymeriproducens]